jgi:hypothetical protein
MPNTKTLEIVKAISEQKLFPRNHPYFHLEHQTRKRLRAKPEKNIKLPYALTGA